MQVIAVGSTGELHIQNQIEDYIFRGDALEHLNVFHFFTDTYEQDVKLVTDASTKSGRGRPKHERVPYQTHHWKSKNKIRVIRPTDHRNLPNIIGHWFPRRDDEAEHDYYCASLLTLLKPWRHLNRDLKQNNQTWRDALSDFVQNHSQAERIKYIISGIQFYHECESAARASRAEVPPELTEMLEGPEELRLPLDDGVAIQNIQEAQVSWPERLHAQMAVDIAMLCGIFKADNEIWSASNRRIRNASVEDIAQLQSWKEEIQTKLISDKMETNEMMLVPGHCRIDPTVEPLSEVTMEGLEFFERGDGLLASDPTELNRDQRRAFDLVLWHLDAGLRGECPPPLRMILYGEGGTGKSKVIQTITAAFRSRGVFHLLQKTAYTGNAASLIGGHTMHSISGMSVNKKGNITSETKRRLQETWGRKTYLIVDECSMISKSFLAQFAQKVRIGRNHIDAEDKWADLNVILCGDFHQFPPVATGPKEFLYTPLDIEDKNVERKEGRAIFEQFTTVVILTEQKRVHDPIWHSFLRRLRMGCVEAADITMLRELILLPDQPIDFSKEPWKDAIMITPRHAVRNVWNDKAVQKTCAAHNETLFISHAKDRPTECFPAHDEHGRRKSSESSRGPLLADTVELAVGMRVLVTYNIETELDITNGASGTVVVLILDPKEPTWQPEAIHHLQFPPRSILVELDRTKMSPLSGLAAKVIPMEPMTKSVGSIQRTQYPITPAYAFTDYRSQGQTIRFSIIDIAQPPHGSLSLFNLYVALSRSPGRDHIRLLRDFKNDLLLQRHDEILIKEDERLQELNERTSKWWEGREGPQSGHR